METGDLDPADPPPMRLRWIAQHPRLSLLLVGLAELFALVLTLPTLLRGDWWPGLVLLMWSATLVYAVSDTRRGLRRMRQWDERFGTR